jgi:hypothetical protein
MNGKWKPKLRFDRMFYKPKDNNVDNDKEIGTGNTVYTLMPVYFELEGLERIRSCGRFCSDHWAIQAYCEFQSKTS